jgi:hypothetical protein
MHQVPNHDDFIRRLDDARHRARTVVMIGSIVVVLGLALLVSIPFMFGFDRPLELFNHYPSLPIMLFLIMVCWFLGVMLVVGIILAIMPQRLGLSCPHCERVVTLVEDKEVRRTGHCPKCHMPVWSRIVPDPVTPTVATAVESEALQAAVAASKPDVPA